MEEEKKLFISTLNDEKYDFNNLIGKLLEESLPFLINTMKDNDLSEKSRKEGNDLFVKKQHTAEQHDTILQSYCRSIAWATPKSQSLSYGYGNRSAFLFHIEKYEECIEDIERALELADLESFKIKLLCRKAQCFKKLSLPGDQDILDEAKCVLDNIFESDKSRITMIDAINKTENILNSDEEVKVDDSLDTQSLLIEEVDNITDGESKAQRDNKVFDNVTVSCDEKYERLLMVNRDFEPGETVFTEKCYAAFLNLRKSCTNCNHCLAPCWSLIPCDRCIWALYCSEKCKVEALNNYHSIECVLVPTLLSLFKENEAILIESQLPIRLLLMGIKETGSIANLRTAVEKLNVQTDHNANINNGFSAAYSLKFHTHADKHQNPIIIMTSILLIKILFRDVKFENIGDILKNEDALFVGSLFVRLWKIKNINNFILSRPNEMCNHLNATEDIHLSHFCNVTGCGLPIIGNLINHSCTPNVAKIATNDQKIIFYALQPIKKGSQLFDCYQKTFYQKSKADRQEDHQPYQFNCDCEACENEWPVYDSVQMEKSLKNHLMKIDKGKKSIERMLQIKRLITRQGNIDSQQFREIKKDLSQALATVLKHSPVHSKAACELYCILQGVFEKMYGVKTLNFCECTSNK